MELELGEDDRTAGMLPLGVPVPLGEGEVDVDQLLLLLRVSVAVNVGVAAVAVGDSEGEALGAPVSVGVLDGVKEAAPVEDTEGLVEGVLDGEEDWEWPGVPDIDVEVEGV